MSKLLNLVTVLLTLVFDGGIGVLWYIVLLPSEPVLAIGTVGATFIAIMFTAIAGFLNWTTYQGCISDD